MTPLKLSIYRYLKAHRFATDAQVGKAVHISRKSAQNHINELEQQGLLKRIQHPQREIILLDKPISTPSIIESTGHHPAL